MPLGLYLHVPFCRKRCHFCYFRVYTDKNAQEVEEYLDVMAREWELYNTYPAINGRPLNFVYFGGGTPSFLSVRQLTGFVQRMTAVTPWTSAEEITFECEPGTLTETKLAAIRDLGVTRLSLGIENFDDHILEMNGRAHRSPEVFRAYQFAQSLGFPQINIDLIAGMLGETEENWQRCVEKTIELAPDSVTDLSDGAAVQHDDQQRRAEGDRPLSGARRELVDQAPLGRRGVRGAAERGLHDRQRVHRRQRIPSARSSSIAIASGRAPISRASGVASFGHINGVHMQNLDKWETYSEKIREGALPLSRAYRPDQEERLIRELVLQLKLGRVRPPYFAEKYGVDILQRFEEPLRSLDARTGFSPRPTSEIVALTRAGFCASIRCFHGSFSRNMRASGTRKRAQRAFTSERHAVSARLRLRAIGCGAAAGAARSIPDDIPLPYRSLLVHSTDMTLTLERHFGGRVALRPLATFTQRPVVLPPRAAGAGIHRAARSRWAPFASRVGAFPDAHPEADPEERRAARAAAARRRRRLREPAEDVSCR